MGLRLNMNAINFISALIFIKYSVFDKQKYNKILRLEKYLIILNILVLVILKLLHYKIEDVK
jgi:hypothetical protein